MKKTAKPKVIGYRLSKEIGRDGMFWNMCRFPAERQQRIRYHTMMQVPAGMIVTTRLSSRTRPGS